MNNLYTASMFKIGEEVRFVYRDKVRRGIIDKVTDSYITLRNMEGDNVPYKSFNLSKMGAVTWYGNMVNA